MTKELIGKLYLIKTNLSFKKHHNECGKRAHRMEKIFANHVFGKGFVPIIHKEPLQHKIKKKYNSKIGKGYEQRFLQRCTNSQ